MSVDIQDSFALSVKSLASRIKVVLVYLASIEVDTGEVSCNPAGLGAKMCVQNSAPPYVFCEGLEYPGVEVNGFLCRMDFNL